MDRGDDGKGQQQQDQQCGGAIEDGVEDHVPLYAASQAPAREADRGEVGPRVEEREETEEENNGFGAVAGVTCPEECDDEHREQQQRKDQERQARDFKPGTNPALHCSA
jgi:hypothetical protein